MKNKKLEANLAMMVSRVFSGINVNALKYLLPLWVIPTTFVSMRILFGALAFWFIACFVPEERLTRRERVYMLLLGAVGMFGYMLLYLLGISRTTPVSSAIFSSLQPIWVLLISIIFLSEKISGKKVIGIAIGLCGALLCITSQKTADVASAPLVGDMCCLASSVIFAVYLLLSNILLKKVGTITLMKYVFTGASVPALITTIFFGGHSLAFTTSVEWFPIMVILFVLIFPTVITYLLIPIGLKYLSTTVVAIYNYLTLIVTALIALLIGQDHFTLSQLLAILLIFTSVYLVERAESTIPAS